MRMLEWMVRQVTVGGGGLLLAWLIKESAHECRWAYDFSVQYMGKAPSHYSVLKARNMEPSIGALCVLERTLINKVSYYDGFDMPVLRNKRGRLIGLCEDVVERRWGRVGIGCSRS